MNFDVRSADLLELARPFVLVQFASAKRNLLNMDDMGEISE